MNRFVSTLRRTPCPKRRRIVLLPLFLLLVLPGFVSCSWLHKAQPVESVRSAPGLLQGEILTDSVGIEVFTIRITRDQDALFRQLWQEVDEQMLEPALRRELLSNGLRVGFLGETLSPSLSRLINVTSEQTPGMAAGGYKEFSMAELSQDLAVTRQYINLMPEMRSAIKIFDDNLPEFSRIWTENGQLSGQTYTDVLGLIQITGTPQSNGRAKLTVMPLLEYGVPERRVRVHNGVILQENGRPRYPFRSLTVSLDLLPGQWLILGPASRESSGAGHALFIRGAEDGEQKILAIRLAKLKTESRPTPESSPRNEADFKILERN